MVLTIPCHKKSSHLFKLEQYIKTLVHISFYQSRDGSNTTHYAKSTITLLVDQEAVGLDHTFLVTLETRKEIWGD